MTNIRNKDLLTKFGRHLRDLRQQHNLSQEQLANKADIPINQVGRIERGEINATLSTLNAISNAFGITLATLMDFNSN